MSVPKNFSESLSDLLGKPYKLQGSGDSYDCWTLIVEIYRRMGIEITDTIDYSISFLSYAKDKAKRSKWIKIDKPEAGCIILLYNNDITCHVAFCIKRGKVIHATNVGVKTGNRKSIERIFKKSEYFKPCMN